MERLDQIVSFIRERNIICPKKEAKMKGSYYLIFDKMFEPWVLDGDKKAFERCRRPTTQGDFIFLIEYFYKKYPEKREAIENFVFGTDDWHILDWSEDISTVDGIVDSIKKNNIICAGPLAWLKLWEQITGGSDAALEEFRTAYCSPLILSGWAFSSDEFRHEHFVRFIKYTHETYPDKRHILTDFMLTNEHWHFTFQFLRNEL